MLIIKERKGLVLELILFCVFVSTNLCSFVYAKEKDFIYFDTKDVGQPDPQIPLIQPWKIVHLDPDYGGQWVLRLAYNRFHLLPADVHAYGFRLKPEPNQDPKHQSGPPRRGLDTSQVRSQRLESIPQARYSRARWHHRN